MELWLKGLFTTNWTKGCQSDENQRKQSVEVATSEGEKANIKQNALGLVIGAQKGRRSDWSVPSVEAASVNSASTTPPRESTEQAHKANNKNSQTAFPTLGFLPLLTAACHLALSLIWSTPVSSTTDYETWPWSNCVGYLWYNDQLGVTMRNIPS